MIAPCARRALLAVALSLFIAPLAAQDAVVMHGSLDAFAGRGVAMAWGVLRGKDEASTLVVVRIDADRSRYGSLAVMGIDPFTRASAPLAARSPFGEIVELRIPRGRFAELPRTEWRFYGPGAHDVPSLVVDYRGIPDTTPEFDSPDRLARDLDVRLQRARAAAKEGR